jgi:hypothetical protein
LTVPCVGVMRSCALPRKSSPSFGACARAPRPPVAAERRVRVIERYFRLLSDSVATYHEWRQLLVRHAVSGVKVYDARLVASMHVYGITHLLTFNAEDFGRYPHITVLEPQHVAQTSSVLSPPRFGRGCADASARTALIEPWNQS